MREIVVTRETWLYECLRCDNVWDVDYEVWHARDSHGGDVVTYRKQGQRCISPWKEVICPHCGSFDVKPLPAKTTLPAAPLLPPLRPLPQEPTLFRLARLHAY